MEHTHTNELRNVIQVFTNGRWKVVDTHISCEPENQMLNTILFGLTGYSVFNTFTLPKARGLPLDFQYEENYLNIITVKIDADDDNEDNSYELGDHCNPYTYFSLNELIGIPLNLIPSQITRGLIQKLREAMNNHKIYYGINDVSVRVVMCLC
jgi:hypothetical protein